MSKSTHHIAIKAEDQTSQAFASIKASAAATGASIRTMVSGAIAFAGAYVGFRKLAAGVDELGKLSDIAQKASMSVDDLTAASAAFGVLGVQNMGIDQFSKSLDYLQKSTGRVGMEGFLNTIGEIGKIEDVAKRSQEAVRVFGRSGMEFMPLINAASKGTDALRGVIEAMPKVPQAAADAGDDVNDATGIVVNECHSLWLQGIGAVCKLFNGALPSSARQGAATVAAYMEYWAKNSVTIVESAWARIQGFGSAVGSAIGSYFGAFAQNAKWYDWVGMLSPGGAIARTLVGKITGKGNAFTDALDAGVNSWHQSMEEMELDFEKFDKVIDERAAKLSDRLGKAFNLERNYKKAAISTGNRIALDDSRGNDGVSISRNIRNDLILGGSNAATKLRVLGPSLQSEQKKTNEKLDRIIGKMDNVIGNQEKVVDDTPDMLN